MTEKTDTRKAVIDALESAGRGMSNICFNLSQQTYIPADVRMSMKKAQGEWDLAIRALITLERQETPPPQIHVRGDLGITKEWFERRAKAEADLEIGAGFSVFNVTDADAAQMEVLAERALPEWAQKELGRLRAISLDMQTGYIAMRDLVERAQAIISTSTYPNWHATAVAALTTKEGTHNG